jgi:FkbM family methyltransferase
MGADSLVRRALKAVMYPVLNEQTYSYVQGLAKAGDIRRGKWHEPEIDLLRYAVAPGDTVLDLGANDGLYAYHLSRAVGPGGRVYAFEPVPFTFRTLRLVSRLLNLRNVTLVDKGCSDAAGRIAFDVPVQSSGAISGGQAHIVARNDKRPGAETHVRWDRTRRVECDIVSLDSFLPEIRNLSLIKSDIEGAELLAFRGAARLIEANVPTVICEINPWFLDGFNLTLEDLIGFFRARGYALYRYTAGRRLVPMATIDVVEDNYVFIHARRLSPFASLLG